MLLRTYRWLRRTINPNRTINDLHIHASKKSKTKFAQYEKTNRVYEDNLAYQDVLCVFQTHNKSHLLKHILSPFIKKRFRNIIIFADGCQDDTLIQASSLLTGKQHALICVNDLHEIRNYRTAITSEWGLRCRYALLMQDDDIYPEDFSWLDEGMTMMENDKKLVVIGFRGGINYLSINAASNTFETDRFYCQNGKLGLPGSYEAAVVDASPIEGKGFGYKYCDAVNRAPQLIKLPEFRAATSFDPKFEPFNDDDSNYCLELWSKGFRVALFSGAKIARDVGIGGMRLHNHLSIDRRPSHLKRNHNYLYERYGDLINSGRIRGLVANANREVKNLTSNSQQTTCVGDRAS